MKDTHPESLPITIGSEKKYIKLGPKAIRLARKQGVKVNLMALSDPDMDLLIQLAWIGLLPDDPTLAEDDFLEALEESGNMLEVISVTGTALTRLTEGGKPKGKRSASGEGKGKAG